MLDPNQEVESPYRRTSPTRAKTTTGSDERSAFSDDEDDFNFNEAVKEVITHNIVPNSNCSLIDEGVNILSCTPRFRRICLFLYTVLLRKI